MAHKSIYLTFLILILLLTACGESNQQSTNAPATVVGAFIAEGAIEYRELNPTVERVRNCDGSSQPVIKHPSLAVMTAHGIEWKVGVHTGVGVNIGNGPVPGGVNLSVAFDSSLANSLDSGIEQAIAWDLPADPNTIVEYTLTWNELWQPGYVEVRSANGNMMTVNISYRTGIKSEIVDTKKMLCNTQEEDQSVVPTGIQPVIPTVLQAEFLISGHSITPENLSLIVGGSATYWTERGAGVWGYWNEGNNATFRHPGENMVLTYWAGFYAPRNAAECQIVIQDNTRFVKCPTGTQAEFEADGVGLHLIDYTGLFP